MPRHGEASTTRRRLPPSFRQHEESTRTESRNAQIHIYIGLLYLPAGASILFGLAFKDAVLGTPIQSARGNLDKKETYRLLGRTKF